MKFVDVHVHLSDAEYSNCVNEIIAEAKNSNVVALVSNSMNFETCVGSLGLAEQYPRMVFVALGIHPWAVNGLTENEFQQTVDLIAKHKQDKALLAIGEVGLDSRYTKIWDQQVKVFDSMLNLAENLGLPAIIHSRGTTAQVVDMLPSYGLRRVLLHWFSYPLSALAKALEKGYYISEGAPTAYSNGIRDVIKRTPITNLLTETDGPVRFFNSPFDGRRTTPAFIPTVAKVIAEIKKMDVEIVADQIMKNFEGFFGVKLDLTD